jgi:HPt (histidine-containing phosphotransfer) domain-containing protein
MDVAGAMSLVAGDDQMLKELCGLFLEQSPVMYANIDQAITAKDSQALQRAAHTLKGAAGALCAVRTIQVAQQLELLARDHDLERAAATSQVLHHEIMALHAAIENFVGVQ